MNPATEALNKINELTVEHTLEEQTEGQFDLLGQGEQQ